MTKIRAAYYLLLIALLMPALPDNNPSNRTSPTVQSASVDQPAGQTFCANHHALCGATNYLLHKFEAKARFPIHVLSNWASQTDVTQPEYRA